MCQVETTVKSDRNDQMLKNVKLVTFDVTRTLLHFKTPPGRIYAEFAASHGVSVDANEVVKKFGISYRQFSQDHPNFGKTSIGWEKWWESVIGKSLEDFVKDNSKINSIARDLINSYKTGDNWIVNDGAEDILQFLKSKGIVVGVISNFDPRLEDILLHKNLHKYFDFVITSYAASCMKPDPLIFDKALSASNLTKIANNEAVHVGDDIQNDYIGPKSSGWQAFLVTDKETDLAEVNKNHVFVNLHDLHTFFGANI